ncbi:hypothetical protein HPB52_011996 [Rhipicephalus sanguineus]|uniref:Uncharacterized protein n=1 Tax=Rhipicephalus sanguineus TaxID=34632 RepID=A0A9D4SSR3_RHISA|nr:hypothetical protein HPB52_011996 [Rhipicephalus sanguineus]
MEASFIKNMRDVTRAVYRTDLNTIGLVIPRWVLADNLYEFFSYPDRLDYILKPSILTPPMYHLTVPMPVRLGTFGVEVAKATVHLYADLRFEGHSTRALDVFLDCLYDAIINEQPSKEDPEWENIVLSSMLFGAALDVGLSVLKQVPSFDKDRLPDVPLTGRQLFYVAQCYTHCGEQDGPMLCNEPLRHKGDFASTFSCTTKSNMRSKYQCNSFV